MTGEVEREELIAQLRADGVKHNPDDILRIARLPDGKIVFGELIYFHRSAFLCDTLDYIIHLCEDFSWLVSIKSLSLAPLAS